MQTISDAEKWRRAMAQNEDGDGRQNIVIAIVTMPIVFWVVVMTSLALFGEPGVKPSIVNDHKAVSKDTLVQPPLYAGTGQITRASINTDATAISISGEAKVTAIALDGMQMAVYTGDEIIVYDLDAEQVRHRIPVRQSVLPAMSLTSTEKPIAERTGPFELKAPSLNPKRF